MHLPLLILQRGASDSRLRVLNFLVARDEVADFHCSENQAQGGTRLKGGETFVGFIVDGGAALGKEQGLAMI